MNQCQANLYKHLLLPFMTSEKASLPVLGGDSLVTRLTRKFARTSWLDGLSSILSVLVGLTAPLTPVCRGGIEGIH